MSVATNCTLPKDTNQSRQSMFCGKPITSDKSYLIDSVPVGGLGYLQDHRIAGNVIFPAAGFCMAGIAVHQGLRGPENTHRPMMLEKLKFRRSLSLADNNSVVLRLRYKPGCSEYTVYSDQDDDHGEVTPHAAGVLAGMHTKVPDYDRQFNHLNGNGSEMIDVSDFYQRLSQSGLNYGPYFKRIVEARVSRRSAEAVTRISCHPQLTSNKDQQAGQITLLDSAFQSLAAALAPGQFGLYVPSRIRALQFFDDLEPNLWCHARVTKTTSRALVGDITIFSDDKRPLMEIHGLSCLKIPQRKMTCSRTTSSIHGVSSHHPSHLNNQTSTSGLRN